MFVFLVIE